LAKDSRVLEFVEELTLTTGAGFKSKHDDCIDTVSMLGSMDLWKPSVSTTFEQNGDSNVYAIHYDDSQYSESYIDSYIV
jgi:hypothetical protein